MINGAPTGQRSQSHLTILGCRFHLFRFVKEREEIYLPDDPTPHSFDKNSRMMLFLRKIRDATHDFSVGYNRKRREMQIREEFKPKTRRSKQKDAPAESSRQ